MVFQLSLSDRVAIATQLANAVAGGKIKMFSGAEPANCAAADPAGLLATGTLPAPAMTVAASTAVAAKTGTWTLTGSAAGIIGSFRIYDTAGVCRAQGSVTMTTAATLGDITVDNTNIVANQIVVLGTYTITPGNA